MIPDHSSSLTSRTGPAPVIHSNKQRQVPSLLVPSAVRRLLRTPHADYPPVVDLAFQRRWELPHTSDE